MYGKLLTGFSVALLAALPSCIPGAPNDPPIVPSPAPVVQEAPAVTGILEVDNVEFAKLYKHGDPVYFGATWCGPCRVFKPVVDKVAKDLGIVVLAIDIDQSRALAEQFGVEGVPMLTYKGDNVVGARPEQKVKEFLGRN